MPGFIPDGHAYYIPWDTRVVERVAIRVDEEGAWRFYRWGADGPLKLRPGDRLQLNHTAMPAGELPIRCSECGQDCRHKAPA